MASVSIPKQWEELCVSTDPAAFHECVDGVFRRLLANLLLDFQNPKYRTVKKGNKTLHRLASPFPDEFIRFLFSCLGFVEHEQTFHFEGSEETLKHADQVYSRLESLVDKVRLDAAERELNQLKTLTGKKAPHPPGISAATSTQTVSKLNMATAKDLEKQERLHSQQENTQKDMAEGRLVEEAVRKTLLNTGRIRNSFFEAKDLTVRTMRHGRVYACTEKCGNECLEAHWHLLTGKNILYSYLAHLNTDGTRLLHLGVEHGYQYNSLPGSPHFGKMVHFSEKLTDENGKLIRLQHDDRPAASCVYCGRLFSELLL